MIVQDVNMFPPEFYPPLTGRVFDILESTQPGTYLLELQVKSLASALGQHLYIFMLHDTSRISTCTASSKLLLLISLISFKIS